MTTIGSSSKVVTLTAGAPHVTLTGTINAYGAAGILDGAIPIEGAVYGPAGTHFTIKNTGTVISNGDSHLDFGIALFASGSITNTGVIAGANGIGILNTTNTSHLSNSGMITGTIGDGIDLFGAAYVTNAKGARISGSDNGVTGENVSYVYNNGSIGGGGEGIVLAGGAAYNSGAITGGTFGVNIAAGAVYNYKGGQIIGTGGSTVGAGITIGSGSAYNAGTVTGYTGIKAGTLGGSGPAIMISNKGVVAGNGSGILLNQAGTIDNAGRVTGLTSVNLEAGRLDNSGTIIGFGTLGVGVRAANGTDIVSTKAGVIIGGDIGALLVTASLNNAGYIGGSYGVVSEDNGTVINTGIIFGGVRVEAGGTLIDTGFIYGSSFAVDFIDGSDNPGMNDRLVINAAATLKGDVDLSRGALEIEADGSKLAKLSAAQLSGIGTLTLDSKAILDIAGTYALAGTVAVSNAGTIKEGTGDALTIGGSITGAGKIELGANTTLALNGAVGTKQVIDFTGTGETLELGAPASFAAKIEKFKVGDTIELAGISLASVKSLALSGGVLTITTTTGSDHITFARPASFKGDIFASFAEGSGIGITLSAAAKMAFVQPEAAGWLASPIALPEAKAAYTKSAPGAVPIATAAQNGWLVSDLVRPPMMAMPVTLQS